MAFKYKNLSRSLVCMLMPMLVACAAYDATDKDGEDLDSVREQYNRAVVAEAVYNDVLRDIKSDFTACRIRMSAKKREALSDYQAEKIARLSDSVRAYQLKVASLGLEKMRLEEQGSVSGRPQTNLDSIGMLYDHVVLCEQYYGRAMDIMLRDYEANDKDNPVSVYQLKKVRDLAWALRRCRQERQSLLKQQAELIQKTK